MPPKIPLRRMREAKDMRAAVLSLGILFFTSGCTSHILINTEPDGAEVYVDGQYLGEAPVDFADSAIVGTTHLVEVKKEGYETTRGQFSRNGNLNVGALIGGLCCLVPFLWVMDYPATVTYRLRPKEEAGETAFFAVPSGADCPLPLARAEAVGIETQ